MERHDTLLIACGSTENRSRLRAVLEGPYNLLEASNSTQMVLLLKQNLDCIASVVLDISVDEVLDRALLAQDESVRLLKQLPVIIVMDRTDFEDLTVYFRYGAADVIPLNYDPYAMLRRIQTITELTIHRKHLESIVLRQKESLRRFSDNLVDALTTIIEYRSMESGHHILRIRNFTQILLEEVRSHCPEYNLTEQMVPIIASASSLHDVGKIGIPDSVLTKPGELTEQEWKVMQTHPVLGCDMLDSLDTSLDREYFQFARDICRYHHERWDGRGYPDGLKGDEIPIWAQVVGLADCYDALTSKRAYKEPSSHAQAVNMVLSGSCGAFSPKLLECFKNVNEQFDHLNQEYSDGRDPGKAIDDQPALPVQKRELTSNLMEKTMAKYYTMVHYMNAFLVEIQLDTGLFQVIYNPYPELAPLQGALTLRDLTDIVACQVVIPEERERMYEVIWKELPAFMEQDLRRKTFRFHHRAYSNEPEGPFEMAFLRIGGMNRRPSLAVVCRKLERSEDLRESNDVQNIATDCTYVCRNDKHFTLVRVGRDTYSLGGYTPQEVIDIFGGRLLDMAFPEEQAAIRREFDRQLRNGTMVRTEYRFICKDGTVGWVVNKSSLVVGPDGQEYLYTFLYDITDIKNKHEHVSHVLQRYETILAQTENILFDLNMQTMHISLSKTLEKLFGYAPSRENFERQLSGETHIHPDDVLLLMDRMRKMKQGSDHETVEIRIATRQGRYLWFRVRGTATRDASGNLQMISGMLQNIDEDKQVRQALEDKANRDSLTKLLNKDAGRLQIQSYLTERQQDVRCALLLLDLDNFKEINDGYGHLFGDTMLIRVSQTLTSLFHSQDIVARIGGDEFMVLVRGVTDRQLLGSQCRRLRDMLVHAFKNTTTDIQVGCSIGIASCPDHGTTYLELFAKADIALFQAKAAGKNQFRFYSGQDDTSYSPSRRKTTPIESDQVEFQDWEGTYHAFKILYQAEDLEQAVNQVIAEMGRQINASRVYIFENSEDDRFCNNTFEWCSEGTEPQIQYLQGVNYEQDIPGFLELFNENGVFYCPDVKLLPPQVYDIVQPQGIRSMLQCAILQNGCFKGYIGFDECRENRIWTKEEIGHLTYFSEILSMFLLKHREHEKNQTQAEELQTILENQNQWIYILNASTYELQYVNNKAKRIIPNVQLGKLCYQTLWGRDTPCEGCPMLKLKDQESAWAVMEDSLHRVRILTEATRIKWQQADSYLMTCRRIPQTNTE